MGLARPSQRCNFAISYGNIRQRTLIGKFCQFQSLTQIFVYLSLIVVKGQGLVNSSLNARAICFISTVSEPPLLH